MRHLVGWLLVALLTGACGPTTADAPREPWDRAIPGMMRERGVALIPTLKLWPYELARAGVPAT